MTEMERQQIEDAKGLRHALWSIRDAIRVAGRFIGWAILIAAVLNFFHKHP